MNSNQAELPVPSGGSPLGDLFPELSAAAPLRGHGIHLELTDGTVLMDATSGTFNLPLGYDHPAVVEAIRSQVQMVTHAPSEFTKELAAAVVRPLLDTAPNGIGAAWVRDITRSTANECAIRIAQKASGRSEVCSLFLSHHGQTLFTTALSGNAFRRASFPTQVSLGPKVPAPYCHRCFFRQTFPSCDLLCANSIEGFIEFASSGSVAALIIEPVLGNGGNIVPPPGYFRRLREICDKFGILIIADEVQTGLGRLGTTFGSTAVGLEPDIITLAKGLGGIGVPMAAVLMRKELDVLDSYEHSFTSGANPMALAAAAATVNIVTHKDFLAEVRRKGDLLASRLRSIGQQSTMVSDVRGLGMMWGLELSHPDGKPAPDIARDVIRIARHEESLILRPSRYGFGNVVKVRPALVVSDDEIEEITDRLTRALRRAQEQIPMNGGHR